MVIKVISLAGYRFYLGFHKGRSLLEFFRICCIAGRYKNSS